MTDREPSEVTNLDRYGNPALPWSRVREHLAPRALGPEVPFFLGTIRPDGRPHAAGIGPIWINGNLYFTSGAGTQKSRNLAVNSACTISVRLADIDVVFEGAATLTTDRPTLERAAELYRAGGWPAEATDGALTAPFSAPSAGPAPWQLYRFVFHTAVGVATAEPYGATRWRFAR